MKQILERTCSDLNPSDPEHAAPDLVRAWKASELISFQMDALDILANPALSEAVPNTVGRFYKVVDKIVRIYRGAEKAAKIPIKLSGSSERDAEVFRQTIHIIPSVFIDNAVKYSKPGEHVDVEVYDRRTGMRLYVGIRVRSNGPRATHQEVARLFKERGRGEQAKKYTEGSGVGLVIAKKVADQHGGHISARQQALEESDRSRWIFTFEMPALP